MVETDNGFRLDIKANNNYDDDKNIIERVQKDGNIYFTLKNNTKYLIELTNKRSTRAQANVKIDGNLIGRFIIDPYNNIYIKRPVAEDRALIFVAENSHEGEIAGVISKRYENGIIEVEFLPEKEKENIAYYSDDRSMFHGLESGSKLKSKASSSPRNLFSSSPNHHRESKRSSSSFANATNSLTSGATILGSKTNQHFQFTSTVQNIDERNRRTIIVRLVARDEDEDDIPIAISRIPPNILSNPYPSERLNGYRYGGGGGNYFPPRIENVQQGSGRRPWERSWNQSKNKWDTEEVSR